MSYPGTLSSVGIKDGPNLDAFSRLRVSQNHILLGTSFRYDLLPLTYNIALTGGGLVTHLPNESSAELSVVGAGDRAVVQSRAYLLYRAGQSQLVVLTAVPGPCPSGVTKRIGLFDEQNGLFLERTPAGSRLVRRTYTSGAAVDNSVDQASWNLDTLDGSGGVSNPSGITLDLDKATILVIDFQWLGMGRVRFGFDIDGLIYYVHEMLHANVLDTVYMTTGTLPVRTELSSTDAASTMRFTCAGVTREGGDEEPTYLSSTSTEAVAAAGQNLTTSMQTMLAIRLRSAYIRAAQSTSQVGVFNSGTTNALFWELVLYQDFTGATLNPWTSVGSIAERSTTVIGTVPATGGHVIDSGVVPKSTNQSATTAVRDLQSNLLRAYADIAGTSPDILAIRAKGLGGVTTAHFTMGFREIY